MNMYRLVVLSISSISFGFIASAADWFRYANERYGYSVEVPPYFKIQDLDDDGWTFVDATGAKLLVFGEILPTVFEGEIHSQVAFARDSGWEINHALISDERAEFMGTKNGRILVGYGIWLCNYAAAFINIDFDAAAVETYAPLVERVKQGLAPPEGCELREGYDRGE